jgi:hypothetical protein
MARQASAEREKRANITKSEGDREAAENLAAAASTMNASPGALQLRTLQTLDSLGTSAANTVVLAVPVDVLSAVQSVPKLADAAAKAMNPDAQADPAHQAQSESPSLAQSFFKSKPILEAENQAQTKSA